MGVFSRLAERAAQRTLDAVHAREQKVAVNEAVIDDDEPDKEPVEDGAAVSEAVSADDLAAARTADADGDDTADASVDDTVEAGVEQGVGDVVADGRSSRRRVGGSAIWLSGAAVLALIFAIAAGVNWWRAGHDDQRTLARQRDEVVLAARLDAVALNTLDYHQPEAALAKWLSISTGTVHNEFAQSAQSASALIKQAMVSTTAVALDAAVSEIDLHAGQATVLVSINVKKTPAKGSASTQRNRYAVTMQRVGGQWKVSNLQTVPVQLT